MGPKEDCCIGPIPFWWFFTPFYATCLLKFWCFRNCLLWRLETCAIGFGTPQTLNMHHSSHFNAFAQSKSSKMWKFLAVCLTPPDKNEKNINLYNDKVLRKAWKSAHIGFWVCWLQFTMLELCVTSTFWVMMVFLNSLWQKMKKRPSICTGKKCLERLEYLHI